MKKVSLTKLRRMTAKEVKDSACLEIIADGEHLFFAIVGTTGPMRVKIESHASMIDASRGKQ